MKLKVSEEEARQRQSLRPESSQILMCFEAKRLELTSFAYAGMAHCHRLDLDICVRRLVTKNSEFEGSQ